MTQAQGGKVETLQELLRRAIDFQLTEAHFCMPGKIESYDSITGTAKIKPTLSRRFRGATEPIEYPVIPNVPVVQPRTAKVQVTMPIAADDPVLLVFADRNIENWYLSSGTEPKEVRDLRRNDLSDAFAILGGYPSLNPPLPSNAEAYEVLVESGTKIALGNGTDEVLQIAHDAFTSLKTLTEKISETLTNIAAIIVTCAGPGNPSSIPTNSAAFLATKVEVEAIKVEIEAELTSLENIKA